MSKAENIITSIKVEIDAPASLVWQVLVDLPRYHEWNPFTVRVESSLVVGAPVDLYVPNPATPGENLRIVEYIAAVEPERLLSWEQRPTAESKDAARRDQYVEALGPERSSYVTTDIFLGVNADEITKNFGAWVKHSFDAVALGVKQRAEALHAARRAA
ncbi:SRPBCC domain-containing protein [Pseudoduganella namucuonensis]|uniref:Polyketide cyclase / dehydrase and lipid transport n=1 Tax=Pseudoduganella namucuonensis TaxID=1035707 RepID=A0A1I7M5X2_9BURK|nr:SRPBCC domain-containing protein [Pseudoduganella namucuonensis]SFV17296.1 Polyketide cyclase / dehydrase and lipid transport [Pseudoduganella namucuonensis]